MAGEQRPSYVRPARRAGCFGHTVEAVQVDPSNNAATGPRRLLERSRPGGRALVGGLLVVVATLGVLAAYQGAGGDPTTSYVVVETSLAAGEPLAGDRLTTVAIDLPPAQAAMAFGSVDELRGAVALAPLEPGDLLLRSAVLVGEGARAGGPAHEFSLSIDRDRAVNGELVLGEIVDVLATYGTGDTSYTLVAARSATVLGVDDGSSGGIGSPGTVVLTLGLTTPDDVLEVAHAGHAGTVTVVRATRADQPLPDRYTAPGPEQ